MIKILCLDNPNDDVDYLNRQQEKRSQENNDNPKDETIV